MLSTKTELSTMASLFTDADLDALLADPSHVSTLFAPTNAAFESFSADTMRFALLGNVKHSEEADSQS